MRVLQAGLAKSGNLWVYRILEELYRQADLAHRSFITTDPVHEIARHWELSFDGQADIDVIDVEEEGLFYRISSIYRRRISDESEYFGRTNHVWTHSPWCSRTADVLGHVDGCVYIIRDPRDRLLSLADFLFSDYMEAQYPHSYATRAEVIEDRLETLTELWVEHVHGYLSGSTRTPVFPLFYEALANDTFGTIRALADYLDLEPERLDIDEVVERTSFSSMREESSDHVREGRLEGWKGELTDGQLRTVDRIAGPLLEALGYPTPAGGDGAEGGAWSADFPSRPDAGELERALERMRRYRLYRRARTGARDFVSNALRAL